jgi:NAD(P)-dependent dehydrogenase (short-subunit alcohol dehydrogenase family)
VIDWILGPDEFRDRVCIVTGAARGIGAAISECLARHGGIVVVADIDLDGAVERAGLLAERGHRAVPCRVDVSSGADVERMVQDATEREGAPSVLINNAGIVTVAPSD